MKNEKRQQQHATEAAPKPEAPRWMKTGLRAGTEDAAQPKTSRTRPLTGFYDGA